MRSPTSRQLAVAARVALGWSNKVIAGDLGISERRVRWHIAALVERCQLDPAHDSRIQVALWYYHAHGAGHGSSPFLADREL